MNHVFNTMLEILRENEHYHEKTAHLGSHIVYDGDFNDVVKTAESLQATCEVLGVDYIDLPKSFYAERYHMYENQCYLDDTFKEANPIIDKDLLHVTGYSALRKQFKYTTIRTFRYNHKTKSFYYQCHGDKWLPVRVSDTFSYQLRTAHSRINPKDIGLEVVPFDALHPLMTEDPFVKLMLKLGYYAVSDYIAEVQQAITRNHSWINGNPIDNRVNLTWTELMQAGSMKEIKSSRWVRVQKLNVNKGKLNVFQLNAVKNIRPYITLEFTQRILQMLREDKIMYSTNPYLFMYIILHQEVGINTRMDGILADTMNMAKSIKRRLDFNKKTTFRSINNLHDQLTAITNNTELRREYEGHRDILSIDDRYRPLVEIIDKHPDIHLIRTANGLIDEGNAMHHCVGSYIRHVNRGACIIAKGLIGNERVTMELCKEASIDKFVVRQVQMKYNVEPSPETYQAVYEMLDEANGESVDYSQYMSTYHAHNRNAQQHHEIELMPVEYRAPIYKKLIPDKSVQPKTVNNSETIALEIAELDLPF